MPIKKKNNLKLPISDNWNTSVKLKIDMKL